MRPGERRITGQELVKHDSRAVDVGGRLRVLALCQFRCHVERRPDRAGEAGQRPAVGEPGHAEVGEPRLWISWVGDVDEDVRGLEITMDDAGRVHNRQRAQHLTGQRDCHRDGELSPVPEIDPEVHAVDEVHHDREGVTLDHQVADSDEMRTVEPEQCGSFLDEPGDHLGVVREFRAQDLHRHLTIAAHRGSPPDLAERAPADWFMQHIARAKFPHSTSPFPGKSHSSHHLGDG